MPPLRHVEMSPSGLFLVCGDARTRHDKPSGTRLEVLQRVAEQRITQRAAAATLGLSYRSFAAVGRTASHCASELGHFDRHRDAASE
jgi:hypothetical protein